MPCDTRLKRNQTISQRKAEVKAAVSKIDKLLTGGQAKVTVGPAGAIAFAGIDQVRDGVTDACAYRQIMATGSAMAKLAITVAEQISGRTVNRQTLAQGVHSHDGGKTWHHGH